MWQPTRRCCGCQLGDRSRRARPLPLASCRWAAACTARAAQARLKFSGRLSLGSDARSSGGAGSARGYARCVRVVSVWSLGRRDVGDDPRQLGERMMSA